MATRYQEKLIVNLLKLFGEDPNREGLRETPSRVLKMYEELLSGYSKDPADVFKIFKNKQSSDLITVTNINFYSLCEHHLIPFFGKVHIGYVPNGRILGFSKFVRLIEIFSKRLQVQETLTRQISDAIEKYLKPKGLIVEIEAEHLCMSMRGVKIKDCITKTTVQMGLLEKDTRLIDQFYRHINSANNLKQK